MAKFRAIINGFTAGEVSPRLDGRTDLKQYPSSCKILKNMIPHTLGGASRRPGGEFLIGTGNDLTARLFPFNYSQQETYALWLTEKVAPAAVSGFEGITAENSFSSINLSGDTAPWATGSLDRIQYCQSADVLYLVHPSYKPYKLSRIASSDFRLREFDYGLTGQALADAYPYRDMNLTATTLTPSATTGTITVTASAAIFAAGHVGAIYKVLQGGTWGAFKITAVAEGGASATATVLVTLGSTAASASWYEGAWSSYRGWPNAICFYQDRLVYLGNKSEPDTIWFSQTATYRTMAISNPTTAATGSAPFRQTLLSQQLNEILWAIPGKRLIIGTTGGEFLISAAGDSSAFGNDNFIAVPETVYGSAPIQATQVGNTVLFIERGRQTLREFVFDYNQDSYVGDNLSQHSNYPGAKNGYRGSFIQTAWDADRQVLWCFVAYSTGKRRLVGITRDKQAGTMAWHQHTFGGSYSGGEPDVLSVAIVTNRDTGLNDVYVCIQRTINEATKRYIERIRPEFVSDDLTTPTITGALFLDSAIVFSGPGTTIGGLEHLEGEKVDVLADGFVEQGLTVTDGKVELSFSAVNALVGLPYVPVLETSRSDSGSQIGTAQGAIKRVHKAVIRLIKTARVRIGRDATHLETPIFRKPSTPENEPSPLFTGDKEVTFPGDYETAGSVYITTDQPLPLNVSCVITEGVTYD